MTEGASVPREEFPAREPWGYRNRLQLRGDGRNFGFFAAGTHQIVSIDRCDIARPELNEALSALRDEAFRRAKESKVEVEVLGDGRVEVAWNSRHASRGFRQVHDAQNESLKAWILERASGGGVLFDLYGGSGNLSLQLADRFHSVHCVDLGAGRLVAGSSSQIPKHFLFHSIDVQKWCEKVLKKPGFLLDSSAGGLAILDPPREGCGRALGAIHELLVRAGVKELIAVGCDADSWARDLARLRERGWVLERLAFFDFFPQTIHFESVARLVRV
jgi:23S rRNA (uracil1939-C5)-methyltransferase